MQDLGRLILVMGVILVMIGGLLLLSGRIPWLGRLPGDILIQRRNFTLYFPLATGLLISVILSLILWFVSRR